MKKILCVCLVLLVTILSLASCNSGDIPEPTVTVSDDGYLMVNGIRTEHKVDKEDVITVEDGYIVVNGVKTEHKVDTEDDNNVPVEKPDTIEIVDGYLVVNGAKTEYKVSECNHIWGTVTTNPTCTAGGYDTMTCKLCEKNVVTNKTEPTAHTYATYYTIDNDYHWFKCIGCDAVNGKEIHSLDDEGICTVCQLPVSSTPGVIYDVSTDSTYAEVIEYNGTATRVKIAEEYNGLPVKNIYNNAFRNNTTITSVVIPDSVTSIGNGAFASCSSLTSIVIPDSVISIGVSAFWNCSCLTSVVIGDNVTSIGVQAFDGCSDLTSIVIPDSVTSIGNFAFWNCSSLTSVVIPDSVTSIGNCAFRNCSNLTSVVIGDSVTSIGGEAFQYCSSLTSIVIGDSVTSIGVYAFSDCSKLQFNEYENCKYLGSNDNPYFALIKVTTENMSSYTIHENTKVIAASAFKSCSRLTSIVIPDSVTSIGDNAFSGCSSITSIVIGDSVTSIGAGAFSNCSSLKDVGYTGSKEEWKAIVIDSMGNYNLTSATIHYNYVSEE